MTVTDRHQDTTVGALLNWSLLGGVFVVAMFSLIGAYVCYAWPAAQVYYQSMSWKELTLGAALLFLTSSCSLFWWMLTFIGPGRSFSEIIAESFFRRFPPKGE